MSKSILLPLVASLTLGLAPFVPEPHIWEKLRFIATGVPMKPVDWFDLAMHGAPWLWLLFLVIRRVRSRE